MSFANRLYYSMGLGAPAFERANEMPSMTTPGMALTMKQVLERFVRGDNINVFEPVYAGDLEVPEFEQMSEMDKLDLARQLKTQDIPEMREKLNRKKAAADAKAVAEAVAAAAAAAAVPGEAPVP